ncbi:MULTISPECIES: hypothetical protein [Zobellia]|uniref:hypothetical protein n=1 Tax=Zobellia TaxID=112040 RepID=UPI001BFFC5B0|nr:MULTISPECIES: hypothetical protein [Zobellia]MBT9186699.1 hypothetical protein [Zobellia russellii]MBU2974625.1 hypothetical protein [Zobellia sp. B3R18]MDO6820689.1 hypothetical protein [Zobellia sp. 1_MG-2023]
MKRIFFFGLALLTIMACKEQKQELVVEDTATYEIGNEKWPKKLPIKPEAQAILKDWIEFASFETSFDALQTVANKEDLSLVIEDMITKQNQLAESTYPKEFDIPQVKSRQKIFKTYMLKVKGDLYYRTDPNESLLQMIEAYNAFRNQFNVVVNNKLDTNLILDF